MGKTWEVVAELQAENTPQATPSFSILPKLFATNADLTLNLNMRSLVPVAILLACSTAAPNFRTSSDYGRICAASVAAYTNAYKNGTDVKTANFIAQSKNSGTLNISMEPSNCIREAEEYARNAAAMIDFFKKAVATGSKVLSPVCDAATLAYIDAEINKDSDELAKAKATNAYVRALAQDPQGDPNGACFEAAQELL